jgi:DNA-binding GntR family transcriptional regulator
MDTVSSWSGPDARLDSSSDVRGAAPPRLVRMPLGGQVAEAIRNDILFGRLLSTTQVSQSALCERYGTSRMPVRDAIRQLTLEGYMVDDGKGHSLVAPMNREDLEDIYVIEGTMCGIAISRVVEKRNKADLDEVEEYHQQMMRAEREDDAGAMAHINWQFHRRINQMAGSAKILAVLRAYSLSVPRAYLQELPFWMSQANKQHGEIVEAMIDIDAEKAGRLMKEHIVSAGRDLIDRLFLESSDATA